MEIALFDDKAGTMAAKWAPDSWTKAEARQLPDYPDQAALDAATTQLTS
jgi:3-deoxy-7-phosphoheptulonate synthase